MTVVAVHNTRQLLNVDGQSRTFGRDYDGANVRMMARSQAIKQIAERTNLCLSRFPRPFFWQSQQITGVNSHTAENVGSSPLYQWQYFDGVPNARTSESRSVAVFAQSDDLNITINSRAYASRGTAPTTRQETSRRVAVTNALNMCFHTYLETYTVTRNDAANAIITDSLNTYNGFTVLDVVMQDHEIRGLDPVNAGHNAVLLTEIVAGGTVTSETPNDIRTAFHALRKNNLPIDLMWSAYTETNAYQRPTETDETGIFINSTVSVNLLDQAVTSRDENSPGVVCKCYKCGRGDSVNVAGSRVRYKPKFMASCQVAAQYGTVNFVGPGGEYLEMNVTADESNSFYGNSDFYLYLNSLTPNNCVNTDRNKIDIMSCVNSTSGQMWIYGLSLEQKYE